MNKAKVNKIKQNIIAWYIVLLPSLLIFTNLGERTYQDVIFVSLIIYAIVKREYVFSKYITLIWLAWISYALWSCLTDYLGSGEFHAGWFIRAELIILLPIFLAWVRRSNYKDLLLKGFKLSLILGGIVSVSQVVVFGLARAHGQENPLVYAACLSIYGLFVVHESIIKQGQSAGIWVFLSMLAVALSGSRGVMFSFLCGLVVLAFFIPKKEIVKSLILPLLLMTILCAGLFADKIIPRINAVQNEIASIDNNNFNNLIDAFVTANFVDHLKGKEPKQDLKSAGDRVGTLKKEYKTSLGYRLAYLRGGWLVFLENPIFGVGSKNDTLRVGQALGVGTELTIYSHVHNAFLQDMVAGGVVKLLLLCLIIFLPIACLYFMKKKQGFSLLLVISTNCVVFGTTNMLFQLTTINIINTLILAYVFGTDVHSQLKH